MLLSCCATTNQVPKISMLAFVDYLWEMKVESIAFLGDRDTVGGFRPLGMDVYPVRGQAEAREALRAARESGCRVLLMTEQTAAWLRAELEEMASHPLPAVLVVPSTKGSVGLGMRRLRSLVEKAVGADVFSREEQERQR